ncbi:MAG: site-specific DNA-methyltransferase [Dactylosporangium sp.]|nr:site-specific DNA-methyltransferase [Dactylosporangium sp.]NNJ62580.1 site-specific DNA-methyltransferase [Dactylosporangium sp.]
MAEMAPGPRLSVLFVGQRSLAAQRRGRFVAGSGAHPARMAPDLAAALIGDYTHPGDLVFDPLAGIGTTLVEAVHLGRDALGMDIEPGWVSLARANVALARSQGATGTAKVIKGDATRLPTRVPTALRGTVSLVLTSPPYGPTMHGRIEHRHGPLTRFHNTYTTGGTRTGANLAHAGRRGLADGIGAVLAGCVPLLKPGGLIVVASRPWRRDGHLVDIPGQVITAGLEAGLLLVDCRRAVHAALRDGHLSARHTFFQLVAARKARLAGRPVSLIQHDDIAVFQSPLKCRSSREPHRGVPAHRPGDRRQA